MSISCFDDLLRAAREQHEPQRLLFVFANSVLPDDSTPEQRARFQAGEGGAFLHLCRLGLVLEQEDICERVAGPQHRNATLARGARDLVPEIVGLGDRFLQVLLEDFVSGQRHGSARA